MTENIDVTSEELKTILNMFFDATDLLEKIPELQDQGRFSEASQHIGAELEARITEMNKLENNNDDIKQIIQELKNGQGKEASLAELEQKVLD